MSHITVGYTDKYRKPQNKGPAGGISDLFGGYSEETPIKNKDNCRTQNGTETLSSEQNSNQVKTTVESRKIEEVKQTQFTTSVEVTNGNLKENGNVEVSTKSTQKVLNTHSDEKDAATPSRRNRVPPGGYSSGFW